MKAVQAKFKKVIATLKPYLLTFIFIFCSFILAFVLCCVFNKPQTAWYKELEKSFLYPPEILFPIIWGIIYLVLIYVCTVSVYKSKRTALIIQVAATLVLFVLWNLFFFTLHSPIFGFLILLAILFLSISIFKVSYKTNKALGWLTVFYMAWLSYLLVLNYFILMIN